MARAQALMESIWANMGAFLEQISSDLPKPQKKFLRRGQGGANKETRGFVFSGSSGRAMKVACQASHWPISSRSAYFRTIRLGPQSSKRTSIRVSGHRCVPMLVTRPGPNLG